MDSYRNPGEKSLREAIHEQSFLDIRYVRERGAVFRNGRVAYWPPHLNRVMRINDAQTALDDLYGAFQDFAHDIGLDPDAAIEAALRPDERRHSTCTTREIA